MVLEVAAMFYLLPMFAAIVLYLKMDISPFFTHHLPARNPVVRRLPRDDNFLELLRRFHHYMLPQSSEKFAWAKMDCSDTMQQVVSRIRWWWGLMKRIWQSPQPLLRLGTILTTKEIPMVYDILLGWAASMVTNHGFLINKRVWHIDFHRHFANGSRWVRDNAPLSWHRDDYGGVNYKCITVIIYLYKSKTLCGGNFRYREGGRIERVDVQEGTVIIFSGNVVHMPEPHSGEGIRSSIVFQFQSISGLEVAVKILIYLFGGASVIAYNISHDLVHLVPMVLLAMMVKLAAYLTAPPKARARSKKPKRE